MLEQKHSASTGFWAAYEAMPRDIRHRADKQFALLTANPAHPSLQFKKIGDRDGQEVWSARVTLQYRSLAIKRPGGFLWFWIGDHKTYDTLVG